MQFKTRAEFDAYIERDCRWRLANLARHVISMPTRRARQEFLAKWRRGHGEYSATALEGKVRELWAQRSVA